MRERGLGLILWARLRREARDSVGKGQLQFVKALGSGVDLCKPRASSSGNQGLVAGK